MFTDVERRTTTFRTVCLNQDMYRCYNTQTCRTYSRCMKQGLGHAIRWIEVFEESGKRLSLQWAHLRASHQSHSTLWRASFAVQTFLYCQARDSWGIWDWTFRGSCLPFIVVWIFTPSASSPSPNSSSTSTPRLLTVTC